MSLLGVNYGSDASDDEGAAPAPIPARAPVAPKPTAAAAALAAAAKPSSGGSGGGSKKPKKKKKKTKIALSILPPEIQAALARAPVKGMEDDDDDDDGGLGEELDDEERARRRKIREQVAASKAVEGRRAAGAKGLFALLPKPKAEEALENAIATNAAPKKKPTAPTPAPASKPKQPQAPPPPQQQQEPESEGSDEEEEEDEDEDGASGGLHPSLLAGSRAAMLPRVSMVNIALGVNSAPGAPSAVAAAATAAAAAAAVEEEEEGQQQYQYHAAAAAAAQQPSTAGVDGSEGAAAAESYEAQWAAYYAAQQAQGGQGGQGQGQEMDPETARQWQEYYYAQQMQQQAQAQGGMVGMQGGVGEEEELNEFGRPKQTSRKDKVRARQALLQGDLGALGQLAKGAQVASVAAPQEQWDPFRHGPPKKQEKVRIAAAFYDTKTGETVTVQDASRTHKRKHHINSLAIQAAEREAELMEGRARGMLTKAQTQGKYGW